MHKYTHYIIHECKTLITYCIAKRDSNEKVPSVEQFGTNWMLYFISGRETWK